VKARRVAIVAAVAVAAAVAVLGASALAVKRWARNRLPGIVLADPTPETLARYGWEPAAATWGAVVVDVRPGPLASLELREGDILSMVSSGRPSGNVVTVATLKARISAELAAWSDQESPLVGLVRERRGEASRACLVSISEGDRLLYLPAR
jgi:hypothetical protein